MVPSVVMASPQTSVPGPETGVGTRRGPAQAADGQGEGPGRGSVEGGGLDGVVASLQRLHYLGVSVSTSVIVSLVVVQGRPRPGVPAPQVQVGVLVGIHRDGDFRLLRQREPRSTSHTPGPTPWTWQPDAHVPSVVPSVVMASPQTSAISSGAAGS